MTSLKRKNARKRRDLVSFPVIFRGFDELSALMALVTGLMITLMLLPATGFSLATTGMVALSVLVALGSRYRCEVDTTGIYFTRRIAFFWPIERRTFYLDARPDLYEAWESTRPEGVFIQTRNTREDDSEPFGPHFSVSAQQRLHDALLQAIERARKLSPPLPSQLRFKPLNTQTQDYQVAKHSTLGRITQVAALEPLRLFGMQIPAGSTLHFNAEASEAQWMDPRREDTLWAIDCAAPTILPWGLEVRAGTRLGVRDAPRAIEIIGAFDGPTWLNGYWVDGQCPLRFDRHGNLLEYTLAEPVTLPHLGVLPPGTRLEHPQARTSGSSFITAVLPAGTYFNKKFYRTIGILFLRAPNRILRPQRPPLETLTPV